MPSAGAHITNVKRGRTCNPSIPSAGKHVTDASARKRVTDAMRGKTIYLEDPKRGKTCNRCKTRENMKPMSSAGKHVADAKSGKMLCSQVSYWLERYDFSYKRYLNM